MSKRKGKADHRVRDWDRRFVGGERVEDETSARRRLTQAKVKIPAGRLLAPQENLEELPKCEGMVLGHFPGGVIVHITGQTRATGAGGTPPGGEGETPSPQPRQTAATCRAGMPDLLCSVAKTFRSAEGASALAVGDLVTVALALRAGEAPATDNVRADRDRADGMVLSRQVRRTVLCRPQIGSGKRHDRYEHQTRQQVIVANMDAMIVVASTVQPPMRPGPIDRFLIVAQRGELAAVLAVNKIDLAPPDEDVLATFRDLGVAIVACSAVTGEGLEELRAVLAGRRSVLAGASGVGKSALINALVPGAGAAVREVRAKDDRGRHTTSAATVYELPGGGLIVDTPGIREIGIRLTAEELSWYFPEFEPLQSGCRFRNCSHTHEPGCAVQAAVEAGEIPARRFESYLRILATLEERHRA